MIKKALTLGSLSLSVSLLFPFCAVAQFVVQNNGALVTVNSGCVATVKTGNLINGNGTLNNAGDLTVEGNLVNNAQLSGGGGNSGIFRVQGNWVNNQTFTADQSTVVLNGAVQSIAGTAISSFYNLTLGGIGIKSLVGVNANVSGTLQLSGLELATQGNVLRVQNPAPAAINAGGGFVSSTGNGRLAWDMNSTATRVFPLGSSAGTPRIRPVAITPTTTSPATFAARMANVNPTSEGYDISNASSEICQVNSQFYHLIDRISGNSAANIDQYFLPAQDGNWEEGAHWQSVPQWQNMDNGLLASAGGFNVITTPSWSDFSTSAFSLIRLAPEVSLNLPITGTCLGGSSFGLSGTPSGGTFSGNGVLGSQFVPGIAGIGQHLVTYSYTTLNGCVGTSSQAIQVYSQPSVSISASSPSPIQLCQGQTTTLTATPGFSNYSWSNSTNGQSIVVGNSGNYSVTVSDANGCQGTASGVQVTVNPVPSPTIVANGPLQFCQGGFVVLSTQAGFGSYNWSNGGTNISSTTITSGEYTVTVTNQFLCSGTSAPVTVNALSAQQAQIFNEGDSMYISPAGNSGIQWFLNGNPIPGATGAYYLGTESGNYTAQYTDANGCTGTTWTLEFTYSGGNTSITEQGIFSLLDLYPNPGRGEFSIRGVLPIMVDVNIAITDMLGRRLLPDVLINATDQFTQPFDISEFANGVYFVRIHVNNSMLTVRYIKS